VVRLLLLLLPLPPLPPLLPLWQLTAWLPICKFALQASRAQCRCGK